MIRTEGIIKRYGAVRALSQLDLSVRKGALYGLLGQNGAGKTTLLRILCGLSMQDAGRIYFEEKDVTGRIDSVKHRIGYLPDYYGIYENMTLMEYLEFFASGYGITGLSAANRCRELLIQVGRFDHVRRITLVQFGIEILDLLTREFLVLRQVENRYDCESLPLP